MAQLTFSRGRAQVQLGGVLYVLFIAVIAIVLLSFLPCVNFLFQLCFDSTTAVVAATTGRPNLKTNYSASGGQTRMSRAILRKQVQAAAALERALPPGTRAKDISCRVMPTSLRVAVLKEDERRMLVQGALLRKVRSEWRYHQN